MAAWLQLLLSLSKSSVYLYLPSGPMRLEGNGREQSTLPSYNQEFIIRQSLVKPAPIRVGDHAPRAEGYKVRHADTLLMLTNSIVSTGLHSDDYKTELGNCPHGSILDVV